MRRSMVSGSSCRNSQSGICGRRELSPSSGTSIMVSLDLVVVVTGLGPSMLASTDETKVSDASLPSSH